MSGWDIIGNIAGLAGSALDYLGENEWLGDTITRLISENPEMDYDKIIEMAVQQSKLNSPNVNTPQGSTTTTFDPETNQPTVTQQYTPEIQALFEMLVGNAGAPVDTYSAPGNFDAMMGKYINDREDHMGLPRSEYSPWEALSRGGANFTGIVPPTTTSGTTTNDEIGGGIGDWTEDRNADNRERSTRDMDRIRQLNDFMRWGQQNNVNFGADNFNLNDTIDEYVGTLQGTDPSWLEQFLVEHGGQLAGLAGALGPTGLGVGLKQGVNALIDNFYWDNNQWQSPADIDQPEWSENLDNSIVNDTSRWGAENSPIDTRARTPDGYLATSQFGQDWYRAHGQHGRGTNVDYGGVEYRQDSSGRWHECTSAGGCIPIHGS